MGNTIHSQSTYIREKTAIVSRQTGGRKSAQGKTSMLVTQSRAAIKGGISLPAADNPTRNRYCTEGMLLECAPVRCMACQCLRSACTYMQCRWIAERHLTENAIHRERTFLQGSSGCGHVWDPQILDVMPRPILFRHEIEVVRSTNPQMPPPTPKSAKSGYPPARWFGLPPPHPFTRPHPDHSSPPPLTHTALLKSYLFHSRRGFTRPTTPP